MRTLAILLVVLLGNCAQIYAQLFDDFIDGNFDINPTWTGDNDMWTVTGNRLRSNSTITNSEFYLSTPSSIASNCQWEFNVNLQFSTSGSNYVDFYLTSNNQNLKASTLSGYFIRIGNTTDEVSLYKNTAGTKIKIADGADGSTNSANNNLKIKVTRSSLYFWTVFTDLSGTGANYILENTTTDGTFLTSSFCGISVRQSTAAFFGKHFFDNINVGNLIVDNILPSVTGINVINQNILEVLFSESVSSISSINLINYVLNNGSKTPTNAFYNTQFANKITITFSGNFLPTVNNILAISNIEDLAGNKILPNSIATFIFLPPYTPQNNDIVINEIMADPTPAENLPEVEYIELFNRTNQSISLQNYSLKDGNVDRVFNYPVNIDANGYLVLVNSNFSRNLLLAQFPSISVYTLAGLSLSNAGDQISLKSPQQIVVDEFNFTDNLYGDFNKKDGGWSLEKINPNHPCRSETNWKASIHPNGGTPGTANSILNTQLETKPPIITATRYINNSSFVIGFSEQMDSISLKSAIFSINNLSIQNLIIGRPRYDSVYVYLNSPLPIGIIYTLTGLGLKDCAGNIMNNNTLRIGIGKSPQPNEVVINEILPDETPSIGLPEGEFIELYNTTDFMMDLSACLLMDATSSIPFPKNTTILPHSYLILCSTSNIASYKLYGNTIGIPGFPSLNNTGEVLSLKNGNQKIISKIQYDLSWYKDKTKEDGGYSLERINSISDCGSKSNWMASQTPKGGTPGTINSVINYPTKMPIILSTAILDQSSILIHFSNALNRNLLANSAISSNQIEVNAKQIIGNNSDSLLLKFQIQIDTGITYQIQIKGLEDCAQQKIVTNFTLALGKKPANRDVVINEVLADENPKVGLPEAEFIELHNRTDFVIDLTNCKIKDGSGSSSAFPSGTIIFPKGFLIVCSSSRTYDFKPFGPTLGIANFPSLNSSDETLTLLDSQSKIISSVKYFDSWYGDEVKKNGGWSLERIDPSNACGTFTNWIASQDIRGGTPGKPNSVLASNPDNIAPKITGVFAIAKDTLLINFDDIIDSTSLTISDFLLSNDVLLNSKIIYSDKILLVVYPFFTPKTTYTVTITNVKDCELNVSVPFFTNFSLVEQGAASDIIINELLFNPKTNGADFVEIYNNSEKNINLKNWNLANTNEAGDILNKKVISADNLLILPYSFKVLTINKQSVFNYFPKYADSTFVEMASFPSLNDTEGNVLLVSNKNQIIDLFAYKDDYHYKLLEKKEGVTLERIAYNLPTNTPETWQSASSTSGYGTPGFLNSQYQKVENNGQMIIIEPKIFTPDEDGNKDFTNIIYNFTTSGHTGSIYIFDSQGREIIKLVQNHLLGTSGSYRWDGIDKNGLKSPVGYYLVMIEIFDLKGNVNIYRESVIIGAKF